MSKRGRVMYTLHGKKWIRREWRPQCSKNAGIVNRQCQGWEGHDGEHWAYTPAGWYEYNVPKNDPRRKGKGKWGIAGGSCPPGHAEYPSPERKDAEHFMSHFDESVVTDKKVIARLKNGRAPERHASVCQPVSMDDLPPEAAKDLRDYERSKKLAKRRGVTKRGETK